MADASAIKAGKASFELGLDDKMTPRLTEAKAGAERFAKSMDGVGEQAGKNFIAKMASGAKAFQTEERASGNLALDRLLKEGPEGLMRLAGFGIAGTIVNMLGEGLGKVTGKAVELRNEFDKGKISAGGIAVALGESLPVIGGFVTATKNMVDMLYGADEAVEAINEDVKRGTEIFQAQAQSVRAVGREMLKIADDTAKEENRRANVFSSPLDREENDIKAAKAARARAAAERAKDQAAENAASLTEIDKAITVAKTRLEGEQTTLRAGPPIATDLHLLPATNRKAEADWKEQQKTNVTNAMGYLNGLRDKRADILNAVVGGETDVEKKADAADDEQLAKIANARRDEFYRKSDEANKAAIEAETQAEIKALEAQGKELEAKKLQIKADERKAIEAAHKNSGQVTGLAEPDSVRRQIAAAEQIADAETNAAINSAHERYGAKYEALHQYAEEQANKSDDANRAADEENEKLKIEKTKRGIARVIAIDEVERRYALAREADPRTATGVDPAKINQKYDLMEQIAQMQNRPPIWGSFNAAAIRESTRGGAGADHQEKIVNELKRANDKLDKVTDAIRQSGMLGQ